MNVSRKSRWLAAAIIVVAATSILSACSSSGEGTPTVKVISGTVNVLDKGGHSTAVTRSATIDPASTVSVTGAGSIAQLTWSDGSYARLAGNSKFVVGSSGAVGTVTRGMIWARAGKSASAFVIRTESGRVTGRPSSLFIVNCSSTCTASNLSGVVTVGKGSLKPLTTAPITSTRPTAGPLRWDAVFGDSFAVKNASLDVKAGFPKASELYAHASPALASLTGTFAGTRKLTKASCTGPGTTCSGIVAGNVAPRTYAFAIDCSDGIPCTGQAVTDIAQFNGKQDIHPRVGLKFDGSSFRVPRAPVPTARSVRRPRGPRSTRCHGPLMRPPRRS
jgi:hypothetical protein